MSQGQDLPLSGLRLLYAIVAVCCVWSINCWICNDWMNDGCNRSSPPVMWGVVGQILQAFRPYCDRKQIRLGQELSRNVRVYLDLDLFEKVLYNLLSNAMKFTPAGVRFEFRSKSRAIASW